jgi:hypothetical protein
MVACARRAREACCQFPSRKDSVVLTVAKAMVWYPYTKSYEIKALPLLYNLLSGHPALRCAALPGAPLS